MSFSSHNQKAFTFFGVTITVRWLFFHLRYSYIRSVCEFFLYTSWETNIITAIDRALPLNYIRSYIYSVYEYSKPIVSGHLLDIYIYMYYSVFNLEFSKESSTVYFYLSIRSEEVLLYISSCFWFTPETKNRMEINL